MNWDIIKGNWKQMIGAVHKEWGELTEDEILEVAGDRKQLMGLLQERYGLAKDEAERQLDAFVAAQKKLA